ncbi:GNAT family N-acetyltransferase [uncultured Sphaerochaeta sp.]|uniref:GNAT family N-acetyltransferase n=1 Tax=uncultured Sphaerochaeta sp. TaxID=886478 RepID=UPI002A0A5A14|nr:GNAT family N-acetyltransferase [uncultured Sphaerochaeta sp.]
MTPRKLTNADIPMIRAYIKKEREMNLFIEGDIEQYGLEGHIVEMFAFSDPWDCILLRYFQNYVVYSDHTDYKAEDLASYLKGQTVMVISGKEPLLERLAPYYPKANILGTYLCRCENDALLSEIPLENEIKRLSATDAIPVAKLYQKIQEFAKPFIEHEEDKILELQESLGSKALGFGLYDQEKLISVAYTTAKTQSGAMVVGVATLPEYRKKGLATQMVQKLCKESFSSGLSFLCLFYDNPIAGQIYRKIGFKEIGRWGMIKF